MMAKIETRTWMPYACTWYTKVAGNMRGRFTTTAAPSSDSSESPLRSYCVEVRFFQSQPQLSEVDVHHGLKTNGSPFTRYIGTTGTCEVFTFGCDDPDDGIDGVDDGDGCGDMLGTSGPNNGVNFYADIEFTVRTCP